MNRCPKCGGKFMVVSTWMKGFIRKRIRVCKDCGYTVSTTEKPDVNET